MKNFLLVCSGGVATPTAYIPIEAIDAAEAVTHAQIYISALGPGALWRFSLVECSASPIEALSGIAPEQAFVTFESKVFTHAVPFKV